MLVSLSWQRSVIFARRHQKALLRAGGALLLIVIIAQMAYPSGHALPGARLGGQAVGGTSRAVLVERIETSFDTAEVDVKAGEKSKTIPLRDTGVEFEAGATVDSLLEYPLWQRLVPFSFLFRQSRDQGIKVTLSDDRLAEVAAMLVKELSVPAEDARLIIENGELTTTQAKPGQKVDVEAIKEAFSWGRFELDTTTVTVASERQQPVVTDEDIVLVKVRAEEIIERSIVITAENGTEFTPRSSDIASWLTVVMSEEGKPELAADAERLDAYIQTLNKEVGVAPGTIRATVVDGVEVARTSASSGVAIAGDELKEGITKALFETSASRRLVIRMVSVPPSVQYDRSYTSSQKGLQAYVDHVTSSEDVRIAVSQVGGKGWSARGRADEQTVAASTYKLYVSYMLFKQIADGKLGWNNAMLDTDVAGCLERMIVLSDNPCAEEFISMFDANAINSHLWAHGISRATTFISREAAQTTANDLMVMLRGIETGSLISGDDRNRLLELMGRQRYRAGVPAGSNGAVYDKVGFLWDYLNDAAIVRHPKGTYTIAILTKGESWGRIAEITRQIEHIMYP